MSELTDSPSSIQLWDRQTGEPAKAFSAFIRYRDGGASYSLARLFADEYEFEGKPTLRTLERWSSKFDWGGRRDAYYDHQDRLRQVRRHRAIADAEELLIAKATAIMEAAIQAAVVEGDVRAQKDLLDRLGLTRKKVESSDKTGISISVEAIQATLQNSTLTELVHVLAQLETTTK